jgi:hypothetical protein
MTYATVLKSLDTLLRSGTGFHAEVAECLNRNGHAPADLINQMARRVEKRYGCEANLTDYGWQFKDADGKRHDAAQRFWQREIRAYDATPMSNRGGANSKQADAVSKLVAAYGKLTAAEKRRFKASI